ncbi:MAG: sensor histidine kinase [Cyanobacteria bacterium CRU_2_1]|nr:sensor histidine kinase [Cyanobacteria bacterium RU_5_0]NJR61630.1 sensor histidine kinase [Cyanobacteria bacterium CRU_2_1]
MTNDVNYSPMPPIRSFRLLLYVEWMLLSLAMFGVFLPVPIVDPSQFSVLPIVGIIGFGLMGLRLPTNRLISKVLYTALELGIILSPILLNYHGRFAPFLGIIAVIRGCQMFTLPGRLVVAGLVYVSFLLTLFQHNDIKVMRVVVCVPDSNDLVEPNKTFLADVVQAQPDSNIFILKLNFILSFGLAIVFVLLLVNSLLTERQSRQKLAIVHEQLRQYALRIEDQATLQERNRIAREIHDSLGHALTAQSIQLENALLFCPLEAKKTQSFLVEAQQLGSRALQEVRQSVAALRSDPLRGQSLEGAIMTLVKKFQDITLIDMCCLIDLPLFPPAEVNTAIYRIIQEALTNIYKHSMATHVTVQLRTTTDLLLLVIEDNGKGFDPAQNTTGFGFQAMRERSAALGGHFKLTSESGHGCRIEVIVPILSLKLLL